MNKETTPISDEMVKSFIDQEVAPANKPYVLERWEQHKASHPSSIAPIQEQKPDTKPPLGIMPEWLWKEKRLQDIRDAIERYLEVKQPIPVNWIAEEYAIRGWLENHQVEIKQKIKGDTV